MDVIFDTDDNDAEETMADTTVDVPEVDSGSEEEKIDATDEVVMPDAKVIGVVSNRHLPSGKEFPAPSSFEGVATVDYGTFRSAPWLGFVVLGTKRFVDEYAIYGWLPEDVPLELTRAWCWRNQCSSADGYFFCRLFVSLATALRDFF